jgi:hypothetical protein
VNLSNAARSPVSRVRTNRCARRSHAGMCGTR